MRRLASTLVPVAVVLVVAASALALDTVRSTVASGYTFWGSLTCGSTSSDTVSLGRGAFGTEVVRPQLGRAIYDDAYGDRIGTLTEVTPFRRDGRGYVRFSVTGGETLCDPNAYLDEGYPEEVPYRIAYSYSIPRSRMQFCGNLAWFYTRTDINANGYVATCRKARRVARSWARRSNAVCHLGRCPTIVASGYTCRYSTGSYTLHVKCRRGRAIVRWSWGD